MQYLAPYFSGYFYPELYLFTQWQEKYEIIIFYVYVSELEQRIFLKAWYRLQYKLQKWPYSF